MLFELHNPATERVSHCGVLEFIADEGMIYMPYWVVVLTSTSFTILKFQDFMLWFYFVKTCR